MVLSARDSTPAVLERVQRSAQFTAAAGLYKLAFQAMNTLCRVHFQAAQPNSARDFQTEVLRWVAWFEARYSRFIAGSLIGRINAAAGKHWVEVDAESEFLLNLCQEMFFFTGGVFDPTALPLISLWNWKAQPPVVPDNAAVKVAQCLVGWPKVQRRKGAIFLPLEGMCLDLGGIGKEYAVDRMLTLALERGIDDVLVDFGQDVRVHGRPPGRPAWQIGLQDPKNTNQCWGSVAVTNHAVATSGDYLRYFLHQGRRYGHIIDPRTGYPADNGVRSVSIIAPHCTMAGILSTTVFILGAKEGMKLIGICPNIEGCVTTDTTRLESQGFYAYKIS
jgi:FAD:protein FMN transferase